MKCSSHFRFVTMKEKGLLIDEKNGVCYGLDETSKAVWGVLQKQQKEISFEGILDDLKDAWEMSEKGKCCVLQSVEALEKIGAIS